MAPRARSPIPEEHAPPDRPGLGLAGLGNPAGHEQPSDQLAALMQPLLFRDLQLLVREFRFNVSKHPRQRDGEREEGSVQIERIIQWPSRCFRGV